jgi:peptide/nickel transport system substrate-binding protein
LTTYQFLLPLVLLLVAGCSSGADEFAGNAFFYNDPDGLNTLDPVAIGARSPWWIGGHIFIGLVDLDSALTPIPRLARSWTTSDDGLRWTFNLRTDIRFADDAAFPGGKGRRVTAEDVRYSFERVCDPATKTTGFWVFGGKVAGADEFFKARNEKGAATVEHVSGLNVINDSTFEITLTKPFPPFLAMLSIPYCYVVPKEAIEKYGADFFKKPVGAGPYRLVEWEKDQRLVLARNPGYYERDAAGKQLPYLDSIVVTFIKDGKTEFTEFQQGRLDQIATIDPAFVESVLTPDGRHLTPEYESYRLITSNAMSVDYYGFLIDSTAEGAKGSPFVGNRDLRQAINYGIDRERIVRYVLQGRGAPGVHGPIPPGTPGYGEVAGYTYDKAKAAALLAKAGYPGGKGLPPITLQLASGERNANIAETVQDQLAGLGIRIELKQVDLSEHRGMMDGGKLPFFRASWQADYPDAENFLALFYTPFKAPRGPNRSRISNRAVDSLYLLALEPRLTPAERASIYSQAERIILEEAPWVILYYGINQRLTQPWISGYGVDVLDRLQLTRVRKQLQSK